MEKDEILELAARCGLRLGGEMSFNEMGIDFKVAFAADRDGRRWVLRIPRRQDLAEQIEREKRILELAKKHLSAAVPDWQIASPELIAYPLLEDQPVITFDPVTYEVTWNIEQNNARFVSSLAETLVELHGITPEEAAATGAKSLTPEAARREVSENIELVKRELGISGELETRWRKWVDTDDLWADFSVFVHGDLYAGHILAAPNGEIGGIIDWSEGHLGDPSVDFAGHATVFGEESLRELIRRYAELGGRTWEKMFEQTIERHAAAPLNYGVFAVKTNAEEHVAAARAQLGAH